MKRALLRLLAFPAIVLGLLFASIAPAHAWAGWGLPSGGYQRITFLIMPNNTPVAQRGQVSPAYFYAGDFTFTDGGEYGYAGLLVDSSGKYAIFSIWGASSAGCSHEPGAVCKRFDNEGNGYQTWIPYNWQPGRVYQINILRWSGYTSHAEIIDQTTGVRKDIGWIGHSWDWRKDFNSSVGNWVEYYGPAITNCWQLPRLDVTFLSAEGIRRSDYTWQNSVLTGWHGYLGGPVNGCQMHTEVGQEHVRHRTA